MPTTPRVREAQRRSGIRVVLLDFDGTMTDDAVYIDQEGRETVRCHRADGWGIRLLREAGVEVRCLTSESNPVVRHRCRKLGIEVTASATDKGRTVRTLLAARGVKPSECVFLGNGLNDVLALRAVGWPVVVRDAHPQARRAAHHVLATRGGDGAVLELAEWVLDGGGTRTW